MSVEDVLKCFVFINVLKWNIYEKATLLPSMKIMRFAVVEVSSFVGLYDEMTGGGATGWATGTLCIENI